MSTIFYNLLADCLYILVGFLHILQIINTWSAVCLHIRVICLQFSTNFLHILEIYLIFQLFVYIF